MFITSRRTLRPLLLSAAALSILVPARAQAPVAAATAAANKAELVQRVHEYHVSDIWPPS